MFPHHFLFKKKKKKNLYEFDLQGATDEIIRNAVRTLNTNTIRLQAVCADVDTTVDKIRNCAFNMAKANRQILTHFQC